MERRYEGLLVEADEALARGDEARALALLEDLHVFAHDEPDLHTAVHRRRYALARRRGDVRGMAGEVLPILFASRVARYERRAVAYEVELPIAAPPEIVYGAIADIGAYADWNPWLVKAEGAAVVGAGVDADVRLGAKTIRASHRVLTASPPHRFAWCDEGWFTPLARGRRFRTIERTPEGSRLFVRLAVVGPFARLVRALHGDALREGLEAECRALAARAARLASNDPSKPSPEVPHVRVASSP